MVPDRKFWYAMWNQSTRDGILRVCRDMGAHIGTSECRQRNRRTNTADISLYLPRRSSWNRHRRLPSYLPLNDELLSSRHGCFTGEGEAVIRDAGS